MYESILPATQSAQEWDRVRKGKKVKSKWKKAEGQGGCGRRKKNRKVKRREEKRNDERVELVCFYRRRERPAGVFIYLPDLQVQGDQGVRKTRERVKVWNFYSFQLCRYMRLSRKKEVVKPPVPHPRHHQPNLPSPSRTPLIPRSHDKTLQTEARSILTPTIRFQLIILSNWKKKKTDVRCFFF